MKRTKVICVHIGARAHYLLPLALQSAGNLHALITDTWLGPAWMRRILTALPFSITRSLAGRFSEEIPSEKVYSFGLGFLIQDIALRLKYPYGWKLIVKRDAWFEQKAVKKIKKIQDASVVIGLSYTALQSFKEAKEKGLKTILFQFDPGIEEEHIVANIIAQQQQKTSWQRAPQQYWESWRQECAMADTIIVNSEWSKTGLLTQGISEEKICIIPLPFEVKKEHFSFERIYPKIFSAERRLRCLFLGTLALRKGIHLVLETAQALAEYPIEFILVGRSEIPEEDMNLPNVYFKGLVTREETEVYYKEADIFLFPTLSDGFGLTQLEAMAWQLPVIATDNCGDIVQGNHNGWQIDPADSKGLTDVLKHIMIQPAGLQSRSLNCLNTVEQFSVAQFALNVSELL